MHRNHEDKQHGKPPWYRQHLKEILIAFGTVVVGGLIIPSIFQAIENLQKELEIKIGLIEQMSESVMEPIGTVQVLEQNRSDYYPMIVLSEPETITKERLELIQEARLIEPQLRSYFRDNSIAKEWNGVAAMAYNFVTLYSANDPTNRTEIIGDIYRFFVENATVIDFLSDGNKTNAERKEYSTPYNLTKLFGKDLTVIVDLSNRNQLSSSNSEDRDKYRKAYNKVQELIKERFDNLSETIAKSRIPEYRTNWIDLWRYIFSSFSS